MELVKSPQWEALIKPLLSLDTAVKLPRLRTIDDAINLAYKQGFSFYPDHFITQIERIAVGDFEFNTMPEDDEELVG